MAVELTESEEIESNKGFKRGLAAGRASRESDSDSGSGISKPNLNDDQGMTWELLMILGIVLLLISPVGDWLAGVVREITTHHNMNLDFNPLHTGTSIQPGTGVNTGGSSSSNAGVGHFIVNLAGGGQMNVNASSPQAAVENVKAQGGTPA